MSSRNRSSASSRSARALPYQSTTANATASASATADPTAAAKPNAFSAEQLLLPFLEPIQLEADAARERADATPIRLGTGILIAAPVGDSSSSTTPDDDTDASVYRFHGNAANRLRPGQRLRCEVGTQKLSARVRSVAPELELAFQLGVGQTHSGSLANVLAYDDEAAWILDRFIQHVTELASGRLSMHWEGRFARSVLTRGGYRYLPPAKALPGAPLDLSHILNSDQLLALESVLKNSLTWIVGPPGAGKSLVLGAITRQLVECDPDGHVLVLSTANAACDVVLESIHRWFTDDAHDFAHSLVHRGVVQRVGNFPSEQLSAEGRSLFIPSLIKSRIREDYADLVAETESIRTNALARDDAAEAAAAREMLTSFEREQSGLDAEIRNNCRVTVAPITATFLNRGVWNAKVATRSVIVDESSMMSPAILAYAAGLVRGGGRLVVCGDPNQLPPVVMRPDHPKVGPLLGRCVMQHAKIDELVQREDDGPSYAKHVVMLSETHRLSRTVASVLSPIFYGGRLRVDPERLRRDREAPSDALEPLIVVDTSGYVLDQALAPAWAMCRAAKMPHAGIATAHVVFQVLSRLAARDDAILLMALYRAHLQVLQSAIGAITGLARVRLSTVHRAQGSECRTSVLSLGTTTDMPTDPFLHRAASQALGARLLNVGLSRSSGSVILVGHIDDLADRGSDTVRRVVSGCVEHGTVIRAADVGTTYLLD